MFFELDMTISISNNSAALTILKQTAAQDLTGTQSATDRIIDIVSGKTDGSTATGTISKIAAKAQSLADAEKSASGGGGGGTVSSEMSRSYSGAVSQAVQSSMNRMYAEGEAVGMKLWEANLENGKAVAEILVMSINRYNRPPPLVNVPTREEWTETVLAGIEDSLSRGADPEYMQKKKEIKLSDEHYNSLVARKTAYNDGLKNEDPNKSIENFHYFGGQFAYRFGVSPKLSFDDAGQAQIGAFEVKYASGQTMLSYDGETLTACNEDGSMSK